jgi:hypothetical protein
MLFPGAQEGDIYAYIHIIIIYIYLYIYTHIQGGSNMTGTNCGFVYTQIVPIIFEPPCTYTNTPTPTEKVCNGALYKNIKVCT